MLCLGILPAAEAAHQILPDETAGKIRVILATFAADGTASLFMVAERETLEKTLLDVDPAQRHDAGLLVQSPFSLI